eukprot:SAG31_NODE_2823_length_5038_cov_3.257340_2_plen_226_part_00
MRSCTLEVLKYLLPVLLHGAVHVFASVPLLVALLAAIPEQPPRGTLDHALMQLVAVLVAWICGAVLCAARREVHAARAADEITRLPGWDGALPSRQYSGMVDAKAWGGQMHQQHYWLVESERDPQADPLVVWYQGGPGASSMFGYFVELGPFWLTEESLNRPMPDGVPRLFRNQFSWSRISNVLFVDFPAPVGFNQCAFLLSCFLAFLLSSFLHFLLSSFLPFFL